MITNLALRIWLPLINDLTNQGTEQTSFSIVASNTAINASGKLGKCYANTSNTAGGLISSSTVNLGTTQSMFCWFKFTSLMSDSSLGGALVTQHRYSKNTGMGITIKYVSSTTGYISVNTGTGSSRTYNTYCGTTLLQSNTWYHGGFTYDGSNTLKIYVNGVCEYTGNIGQMSCPAEYIGIFAWSLNGSSGATLHGNYKLNGSINDVRIYDECLSAKQVEEISKGLILHYPLDDATVEDTTNLCTVQYLSAATTGGWGGHTMVWSVVDSSTMPIPCSSCNKVDVTYSGSGGGGAGRQIQQITVSPSTMYYYSAYIKTSENFTKSSIQNMLYRYEKKSDGTAVTEAGCFSTANKTYLGDGWYRIWGSFTTNANTGYLTINFFVYPNSNQTYYIGCWQLEQKDHLTPYVLGTRANRNCIDVSGYKHHSTYNATATTNTSAPRFLKSTLFGAYGTPCTNFSDATMLSVLSSCTVTWWEKPTTTGNTLVFTGHTTSHYIGAGSSSTRLYDYNIGTSGITFYKDGVVQTTTYDSVAVYHAGTFHTANEWHHFALTGINLSAWTEFHLNKYSSGWPLNAYISDVRIYATVLSATQVQELCNTPVSKR